MKYSEVAKSMEYFIEVFGDEFLEMDHDVLFGPSEHPDDLADHVVEKLEELGWNWSGEYDCWCAF